MKIYADRPGRLAGQVIADLVVLLVIWWAIRAGRGTQERVAALAGPGRDAEAAARDLDGRLRDAAAEVRDAPLVGDALAQPFRDLAATSRDLAESAQAYQDTVADVALLAGIAVAALPIMLVLSLWLPRRLAWIAEASAASRLQRRGPVAADLLAVRALARQPLGRLARLDPAVVTGWKAGDPDATRRLAQLELDDIGLRLRG
jgi:hypothetical protein